MGFTLACGHSYSVLYCTLDCTPVSAAYWKITTMNELYNETIERQGKIYHYDPDRDIYYRRYGEMSLWDRWSPLVIILVLAALALYFEYYPVR